MKLKKKKSTKLRKTIKKRRILSFYSKGLSRASGDARRDKAGKSSIYIVLIIVIILGSIIFAQGIFPKSTITNPPNNEGGTVISEAPKDAKYDLQLDTIKFQKCGETVAVDFLVDNSGSMEGDKMQNLQNALLTFGKSFPDKGVIAMQIYSSPDYKPPQVLIPFSYYRDLKSNFVGLINSMTAIGGTHSKDAFNFSKEKLSIAINDPRFKKQKLNLIFISDGIPETKEKNNICPGGMGPESEFCGVSSQGTCRCFDTSQDPTQVAAEIKSMGVKIFSIGYINSEDDKFKEKLRTLMTNVASSPSDFYEAPITNQITEILKQITTKFCNS